MATSAKPEPDTLEVAVELDVPGETARQARVFVVWLFCLFVAVSLAALRRPQIPATQRSTPQAEEQIAAYRRDAIRIALGVGLLAPGLWTWWITHRRRRGGPHARGIAVAITADGELRLWGRGYGQRLVLAGAEIDERLVDVFTGRLGAWRQRRMRIRAKAPIPNMPSVMELATLAADEDDDADLELHGGEGDCVELSRADYFQILALARRRARSGDAETADSE